MTERRALLIEDEDLVRVILKRLLITGGYHVTAHGNADDGLRDGLSGHFDIILCDLNMQGMDGISISQALFRAGGIKSKFILISGNPDPRRQEIQKGLDEGSIHHLLVKPVPREQFLWDLKVVQAS